MFKKVLSVPSDDKHPASTLLLFRIGCLNFVFPWLSSQLALAGGGTATVRIICGRAAWQLTELLWINGQLVGLSCSASANTRRGCDIYIAAPWRTKWSFRRRSEIAKCEHKLRHASPSIRVPEWNSSDRTGRIFMKFDMFVIFCKSIDKIEVSLKSATNSGTVHANRCTFMIVSGSDCMYCCSCVCVCVCFYLMCICCTVCVLLLLL